MATEARSQRQVLVAFGAIMLATLLAALEALRTGVQLADYRTRPAAARLIEEPEWLWARVPPIRERRFIPTSWIELELTEGKNRQVRHMTAAVGFPTLRLIRYAIGPWSVSSLEPGK